jgi:hypothetical protein
MLSLGVHGSLWTRSLRKRHAGARIRQIPIISRLWPGARLTSSRDSRKFVSAPAVLWGTDQLKSDRIDCKKNTVAKTVVLADSMIRERPALPLHRQTATVTAWLQSSEKKPMRSRC